MSRIVVAVSGGVDSSTVFMMLHKEGHEVAGITMRHLPKEMAGERIGSCCAPSAVAGASRLAASIGRPHYVFDLEAEFSDAVMERTAHALAGGITPNPCVWCNERVKFDALVRRADALGAERFATGHYARIIDGKLFRAVDTARDQSYFLYRVRPDVLRRTLFPLGELTKPQVRDKARAFGIEMHDKEDSMDVCFAPDGDFSAALERFAPSALQEGDFVDEKGRAIGHHRGIGRYTIGQRRGLGVAAGERLFVRGIDAGSNAVVLGQRPETRTIRAGDIVLDDALPERFSATARIRSQHRGVTVEVRRESDGLDIRCEEPQSGVTPGQSIVFYDGDRVLGGGVITASS